MHQADSVSTKCDLSNTRAMLIQTTLFNGFKDDPLL